MTAEQEADSVGLTGDRRVDFLRGWNDERKEQERERKKQLVQEYEEMAEGYEHGDPVEWEHSENLTDEDSEQYHQF